jgi:hypothetical protein
MKHFLFIIVMMLAVTSSQAADVGVSVSVGQPGFYGRIDIGNYPQPEVIYAKPVVVRPAPADVVYQPVYVHVPPGHEKKWSKHCAKYNACGRPVYFVRDRWYNDVYVPQYQARHGKGNDGKHNGKHDGKQNGKHGGNKGNQGHGKGHD